MRDLAPSDDSVLLSCAEMAAADRLAVGNGVSSQELMEAAGGAIADLIQQRFMPQTTLVLCGPGNNGGDGFVCARHLAASGWPVRIALLGERRALRGDARWAAQLWEGDVGTVSLAQLDDRPLVVDALFGAGLARPLEGEVRRVVEAIDSRGVEMVAVDVPSGLNGDTGRVEGAAAHARATVTFFRPKPGHFSVSGRQLCGELKVAEIGIPRRVLSEVAPRTWLNGPGLWKAALRQEGLEDHKYRRGEAVVFGGEVSTGAARLAALAARRAGAGLLSLLAAASVIPVYQAAEPGNVMLPFDPTQGIGSKIADPRKHAFLIGPGAGVGELLRRHVTEILALGRPTVLDADALTSFARQPGQLFDQIKGPCVLTPHEGEFARLFPDLPDTMGKLERARRAAYRSNATVLLKGPDTTIAAPDGRAVINHNAPPSLATAGSGDVLAGLIVGLLAQGMAPLAAAAAGAWIHGEAAQGFGPGLIAEDLLTRIPSVLAQVQAARL
jgi:hydroxyethylthiazole kinase-like uncharacterized protein yjeF